MSVLHLRIEWNGRRKIGNQLSPKFIMTGNDFYKLESVSCKLDKRLPVSLWEDDPGNIIKERQGWSFIESLSLVPDENSSMQGGGKFPILFSAKFLIREGNLHKIVTYETFIPLKVEDDKAQKKIVVNAEGENPLINLSLSEDDNIGEIQINAKGDTPLVNVSKSLIPSKTKNERDLEATYDVDLDPCDVQSFVPWGDPVLLLRAKLPDGQERFFQISARQEVILGRCRSTSPKYPDLLPSDFVYRFGEINGNMGPLEKFLTKRISNNYLRMTLSDYKKELVLTNTGTNEIRVGLNDREFLLYGSTPSYPIDLENLDQPANVVLANFSSLILDRFKIRDPWDTKIERILRDRQFLIDPACNYLWNLGTKLGVNSIRVKRSPEHPISETLLGMLKDQAIQSNPDIPLDDLWWKSDLMAGIQEYHLLVRMMSIGSDSKTDAILFKLMGMAPRHATLYFCDNNFGLINNQQYNPITYNKYGEEHQLLGNECLPLQPGMTFRIGNVEFKVFVSYNNYLEVVKQELVAA